MSSIIHTVCGSIEIIDPFEFMGRMEVVGLDNANTIHYPVYNSVYFNTDGFYREQIISRYITPSPLGSDWLPMLTKYSKKKYVSKVKNNWASLVDIIVDEAREIAILGKSANVFVEIEANSFLLTNPKYYKFYLTPEAYSIVCTVPEMDTVYIVNKMLESHMPQWF